MKGNDLTNKQFGRLKVLRCIGTNDNRNHIWECQCKCGNIVQVLGVQLTRKNGTVTCEKCRVIDGKNDIPTIAPWMTKYFKFQEDIYKYTYGSGKQVLVKCPNCEEEKFITVKDLYKHKSIGCICSDTVSYPEKFIFSLLKQLNINFYYQYSPEWIGKKRYDFYVPFQNLIIEVDGGIGHGHRYSFGKSSMSELIAVDKYKEEQALQHNLNVVRINAHPSTYEVLVDSIKENLDCYFDLSKVNFLKCDEFGSINLIKEICLQWNDINNLQYFIDTYKLSDVTIRRYLKKGTKLGWCHYSSEEEKQKNIMRNSKKIKVYQNDYCLGEFNSCAEFARIFNQLQNEITINPVSLANIVNKGKKYKGLIIERV